MYENIKKAVNSPLSNEQKNENFRAFNALMEKGVYLPDLLDKIKEVDELKKRIEEMQSPPINAELYAMMESAVKDDAEVMKATEAMTARREAIIDEMCRKDPDYVRLSDARRTAIEGAYARKNRVKPSQPTAKPQ